MIQYNTMSLDSTVKRFIYKTAKNKIKGMICPDDLIGSEYQIPYPMFVGRTPFPVIFAAAESIATAAIES